jgi:phosphatidylinositol alpha-1,6-mannosyltransferase
LIRVGVIAPEFPPLVGGMSELARGLSLGLNRISPVVVVTSTGGGDTSLDLDQRALLTGDLHRDAGLLKAIEVDAWLALNGGLSPLVRDLNQPFFLYLHGNDFLAPWIACGPWWLEQIQRPYAAVVRNRLRRRAVSKFSQRAQRVFCNSNRTAQLIAKHLGLRAEHISVCTPGVGDEFFQDKLETSSMTLHLLTVSSLSKSVPRKNIEGVMRAVQQLLPTINIEYTVVGGGDDLERLELLSGDLGIARQVIFRGRIGRDELLRCYREADLFVLTSKASECDVEGFGIVYLEASASGVPVVCSAEGGAVDAVNDGVNGILIPRSSPQCIAEGISHFVRHRDVYSPARAREFAEGHRWQSVARRLYDELASYM